MNELAARVRRHQTALSVAVLAALAYLPALTASPGRMPTDSKLYVYLDPGRFIADTTTTFDARQFAGWVPHQHIAYLWPTGPWYWVFETLGVPDWIAHRLWIGTVLFAAGLGVRWMSRVLGFSPLAALAGAVVYQLSPYILPYISRTSVLLLPFAGLGWIVGCTVLAGRRGRWRFPAIIALIVFTVGAVNATALAMIIPAPVLWLVHAAWQRSISWRRAIAVGARVGVLSLGVSSWWMAMLIVQGRHGADVLSYSESLESVSFTSTSTEVTRGLGYWLFYIRDAFGATTTASIDHLVSLRVIVAGFVLLGVCLAGIVFVASPHRRFAGLLVAAGAVLGVGVHPIDDPSPLMTLLVGDNESGLALALRSSTRAVPVLLLGLAIGAAALVSAAGSVVPSRSRVSARGLRVVAAGLVGVLAVVNLPALRTGGFVDPALERDQDPPAHWLAAAANLDERPEGYRVLQVPGTEFGAFDWGFTVDQPLPGLTERPLVTRDLLPLGSPAAMDLVFALDDRFQEGTLEPGAVAAVARLLGVDTVWVSGDVSFERFGLARPEIVTSQLTGDVAASSGLVSATEFGDAVVVSPTIPIIDATTLGDPRVGLPIAPITLVDVADPVPTVRVKDRTVVVSGSGDGLIDAAAAGLLDGTEAVLYSASGQAAPGPVERLIVTDSNRDRAHHWRSSQDVAGYTESGAADDGVLRFEAADQRLPVFGDEPADPATQTVSVQRGMVTARASAYGEPFAYLPEHRPVMAIDGDLDTAWLVADRASAIGEFIELTVAGPVPYVELRQPDPVPGARTITEVLLSVDGAEAARVALDERSLAGVGQQIELDTSAAASDATPRVVRIEITGTSAPQPPVADAIGAVGFAEIGTGHEPTVEWIRPPIDGLDADGDTTPVSFVFSRLRTDPSDRWRSDPEPALRREVELPRTVTADLDVTMRFDRRASGAVLAQLLDEPVIDNRHLTGSPERRGSAAFDGDPATAWTTPFVDVVGSAVTVNGSGTATTIDVEQPVGEFSPITALRLTDAAGAVDVAVVPGASTIALSRPVDLAQLGIEIIGIDEQITIDRRFAEPFVLPAAISEVRFDGVSPLVTSPDTISAVCRDDLLSIAGTPIGVTFTMSTPELLAGGEIPLEVCEPTIALDGRVQIESTPGSATGIHIDRVVLSERFDELVDIDGGSAIDPTSTVLVEASRRARTVEVPPCPDGCWVVLGEGYNDAWSATLAAGDGDDDDVGLGVPTLLDGNANGWWLEPSDAPRTVELTWTAQRPLNLAFALTLVSLLVVLGLVVRDRRRDTDPVVEPLIARPLPDERGHAGRRRVIGAGVATAVGAAVLVDWTAGLVAGVVWAAAAAVGRTRLVGWVGAGLVVGAGVVVAWVVRAERPFPNAGWPIRFEWLHAPTLLGVVLVAGATLLDRDVEPDAGEAGRDGQAKTDDETASR